VFPSIFASLESELAERSAAGLTRRRRLLESAQGVHIRCDGRQVLSFCSNDYLGLANDPGLVSAMQAAVAQDGVGGGASHLITGHHQSHQTFEQVFAEFVGMPEALLFSTGYMANLGIITALLGRSDAVFADKLNHASLNDAVVLSRAEMHRYSHNDMQGLESLLAASEARRKLVVVDAVFSMDGDLAPVPELLALCERYDALLLLDDAHGFGVLGNEGRGILNHFNIHSPRVIYMATLGKAAGVSGACVVAESIVIQYLIQQARTYIYTTASPPAMAKTLLTSLEIIRHGDARRAHLTRLVCLLREQLQASRWVLAPSQTAIQPLMIGENDEALKVSEYLLAQDIVVPAIRPPTVPKGTARLRISLSALHTEQDVIRLATAIRQAEREV
jgi:8-amino-7-oxononanoate synthase